MTNNDPIIVLYHGNCPDGAGAAWAAWTALKDTAQYIPRYYNHINDFSDINCNNAIVYMLDFCFNDPKIIKKLCKVAKKVIVIDHHKSAKQVLDKLEYINNLEKYISMDNSGAILSWKYFHPGTPFPKSLLYIEDRDIWKWKYPESKHFLLALDAFLPRDNFFNYLSFANENTRTMIDNGLIIESYKNKMLNSLQKKWSIKTLHKQEFVIINEGHKELISDIGNIYIQEHNLPSLMWIYNAGTDTTHISFRSADHLIDVADFSKKYFNGGGHRNASGGMVKGRLYFDGEKPKSYKYPFIFLCCILIVLILISFY